MPTRSPTRGNPTRPPTDQGGYVVRGPSSSARRAALLGQVDRPRGDRGRCRGFRAELRPAQGLRVRHTDPRRASVAIVQSERGSAAVGSEPRPDLRRDRPIPARSWSVSMAEVGITDETVEEFEQRITVATSNQQPFIDIFARAGDSGTAGEGDGGLRREAAAHDRCHGRHGRRSRQVVRRRGHGRDPDADHPDPRPRSPPWSRTPLGRSRSRLAWRRSRTASSISAGTYAALLLTPDAERIAIDSR